MKKSLIKIGLIVFLINMLNANSVYESDIGGCPPSNDLYSRTDGYGFYSCQCTSYVAWKVNQNGIKLNNYQVEVNGKLQSIGSYYSTINKETIHRLSHAGNWDDAVSTINIPVDNSPKVGDIAVWEPYIGGSKWAGHVAYVESVNSDGSVNISEYNFHTLIGYGTRKNVKASHYIHIGSNTNQITRAKALKLILDKFDISTTNAGFNSSRFGKKINIPTDVTQSTSNYDAIVVGYNRGITNGENRKFYPARKVSLQEFITMIVRTIPIPLNNPKYNDYDYADSNNAFYKYLKAAYNAKILENRSYDFDKGVDKSTANSILSKAFEYFRGDKSGISIYMKWKQKYVDLDLYAFSSYDADGVTVETDDNRYVTNIRELKNSDGIVYWYKYSSSWGTNLDYDSWGGNGNQPWVGFGEERSTVDSLMVRRPGKYSFIICYYDWRSSLNPSSANYEMIGYKGSKNITQGGVLTGTIRKGECKLGGTLTTK